MIAIVIEFDRLAVSSLGCYGAPHARTPHFDALATRSVVFDQHFAADVSVAEVARLPNASLVAEVARLPIDALHSAGVTFLHLIEQGSRAVAGAQSIVSHASGFDIQNPHPDPLPRGEGGGGGDASSDKSVDVFTKGNLSQKLAELLPSLAASEECALVWLSLAGETGDPRDPAVASDALLGELLEPIDRAAERTPLLLIVTAAEGLPFKSPPAILGPRSRLSEEIIHTPLFLRTPTTKHGHRTHELVQSTDIVPTLLDWFGMNDFSLALAIAGERAGVRGPSAEDGPNHSLLPLACGNVEDLARYLPREHVIIRDQQHGAAIRTLDFYAIAQFFPPLPEGEGRGEGSSLPGAAEGEACGEQGRTGRGEGAVSSHASDRGVDDQATGIRLYRKPEDIWEVHDVAVEFPEEAQRLGELLDQQ